MNNITLNEKGNENTLKPISSQEHFYTPVSSLPRVSEKTKNIADYMDQNPFHKSSVIRRTPPQSSSTSKDTPYQQSMTETDFTQTSDAFSDLGKLIVGLMDYVKIRNNVHHAIKDQVRAIRVMYNKAREEVSEKGSVVDRNQAEKSSQTSPKIWPAKREPKRDMDDKSIPKIPIAKKPKQSTQSKSPKEISQANTSLSSNDKIPENEWILAKKKKKIRQRKTKPDTMILSTKGETTYAEILKKIRSDPELKELGEDVNKVRRTQKGDIILELKAGCTDSAEKFNGKLEKSLNGSVDVKIRRDEMMIQCKDMDDITTKYEICQAFTKALDIPALEEKIIKSIRKTYGGTQTATIILPADTAKKALMLNKIKIGWSICRIRESVSLTKCFRCLEFGHISKFCKSDIDRSTHCIKCGLEGHFARDCKAEPCCMLCKSKGETDLKHIAGSYKCPIFKTALSSRRK